MATKKDFSKFTDEKILVKCFNFKQCNQIMEVSTKPVRDPITSKWIKPRLEGPWICQTCRQQPRLLNQARKIMTAKPDVRFADAKV